jgi:hypothetical protein
MEATLEMQIEKDIPCPACKVPTNKGLPHGEYCPLGGRAVVSLRDQFAMAALRGMSEEWPSEEYIVAAEVCYRMADAMMEARKLNAERSDPQ